MRYIALSLAVLAIVAISFYVGARQGASAMLGADAKYRASMSVYLLDYLSRKDYQGLKETLDLDVDLFLISHLEDGNSPLKSIFPELSDPNNNALRHAAKYRLANPNDTFSNRFLDTLEPETAKYYREIKPHYEELLIEYGK